MNKYEMQPMLPVSMSMSIKDILIEYMVTDALCSLHAIVDAKELKNRPVSRYSIPLSWTMLFELIAVRRERPAKVMAMKLHLPCIADARSKIALFNFRLFHTKIQLNLTLTWHQSGSCLRTNDPCTTLNTWATL